EAVPLGHALQRHHDPVVGSAVALHRDDLGRRARRVAAVPEHRVDRVEALPRAALRPLALERYAQREHFPGGRQTAGRGDRVGCDEVQGADLVVGPPPPPVPHLHRELAKRFLAHGRQSYANRARPSVNMSDVTARTDRLLLANAIMGQFLTGVATRIFIVALPTLAVALDTDIIAISWALIVYQLAGISLSVVFGRLGDIHGRYAIYGLGFAIMTVSFVLCGLAPNAVVLIVFRLVQGLGAAMIASATRVLAMEAGPRGSEGRANGGLAAGGGGLGGRGQRVHDDGVSLRAPDRAAARRAGDRPARLALDLLPAGAHGRGGRRPDGAARAKAAHARGGPTRALDRLPGRGAPARAPRGADAPARPA